MPLALGRRQFVTSAAAFLAAPAVASAVNLMPLRGLVMPMLNRRWLAVYDIASDRSFWCFDMVAGHRLTPTEELRGVYQLPPAIQAQLSSNFAPEVARAERLCLANPGEQYHIRGVLRDSDLALGRIM